MNLWNITRTSIEYRECKFQCEDSISVNFSYEQSSFTGSLYKLEILSYSHSIITNKWISKFSSSTIFTQESQTFSQDPIKEFSAIKRRFEQKSRSILFPEVSPISTSLRTICFNSGKRSTFANDWIEIMDMTINENGGWK